MIMKGFGGILWRTKNLEDIKKWYSKVLKLKLKIGMVPLLHHNQAMKLSFPSFLKMTAIFQQNNK